MSALFGSLRTYCLVRSISRYKRSSLPKSYASLQLPTILCLNRRKFSTDARITIANAAVRKYLDSIIKKYDNIKAGQDTLQKNTDLVPVVSLLENRLSIVENMTSLSDLGKDKEIKDLVAEEMVAYKTQLALLDEELIETILSNTAQDACRDVILEVTAGVGGQEAMLFAKDIYEMYLGYLDYLGYEYELMDLGLSDIGGTRHVTISVSGDGAFSTLRHEAGVHRVQRIPTTEKSGRVHTSTVTVAVLPQPSEIEISLADKDLKIETKRASGAGGQHVNTTDSAVRMVHLPTGITVECQSQRSQLKNRELALRTLRARIYAKQLAEQQSTTSELRRSQRGLGLRNEKIRTYNYQQNRVTDHRIANGTVHNLKGFLEGGEVLANLGKSLEEELRKTLFLENVNAARNG
ncbi:peptide chain release factor 1-like, mitochondrial [Neodiprion virginianus]|uniref:peptide chain release factor 1-like, mitochondrial n=1 Tax=Neodiprion virginianus TaxID=2961670 RepID=UPI001EE6C372|nr:peptide chain release factor 1-like, mitochondrial [Neodiprion virginianus]